MFQPKFFHTITGQKIPLPVFFHDATRAVLKTLDSIDIANTKTPAFWLILSTSLKTLAAKLFRSLAASENS